MCAAANTTLISCGYHHTGMILSDGTIKLWGRTYQGALGDGTSGDSKVGDASGETPDNLTALGTSLFGSGRTVVSIACGLYFSGVVLDNGEVWMTGHAPGGELGQGTSSRTTFGQTSNISNATDIACGSHHTVVLTSTGKVKTWGWNRQISGVESGAIGVGATNSSVNAVTAVQTDASLNSGSNTLDSSGHINIQGAGGTYPGDGNYTARTVVQIAAGGYHNICLLDDGKVVTWGYNNNGQLGNGNTTSIGHTSNWELAVPVSSDVVQIAAGEYHSIALKSDGTIVVWGLNSSGQMGVGSTTQQTSPATVSSFPSSATVLAVGASKDNCWVVTNGYALITMGKNSYGMLGNNSNTNHYGDGGGETWANATAVDLGSGRTISETTVKKATSTGGNADNHMGVVLDDATFHMWGYNNYGQLGLGDANNRGDGSDEVEDAVVSLGDGLYISGYSSGSGGDPYIRTADGRFYKMDNFTGFFRLVQGDLGGKQLTINGYCQLDDVDRESGCNRIISDVIIQKGIKISERVSIHTDIDGEMRDASVYQTTDLANQSFIKVIYIRYSDDELILRLEPKLEIILNNSSFEIKRTKLEKGLSFIPMYKDMKACELYIVKINSIEITISYYFNPQIRNGFMISDVKRVKDANGILVNTLDREHSEIDNLDSLEPLHNEDILFRTQNCEFFLDSDDPNAVQKNYAIKGFQTGTPIRQDVSNIAICL